MKLEKKNNRVKLDLTEKEFDVLTTILFEFCEWALYDPAQKKTESTFYDCEKLKNKVMDLYYGDSNYTYPKPIKGPRR